MLKILPTLKANLYFKSMINVHQLFVIEFMTPFHQFTFFLSSEDFHLQLFQIHRINDSFYINLHHWNLEIKVGWIQYMDVVLTT